MRILISIIFCSFMTSVFTQTNYEIEYDFLNNDIKYFQCDWIKGKQKKTELKSIKLSHNDIVTVHVVNVNPFIYHIDIEQTTVEAKNEKSPFSSILGVFTNLGGPAFNLLTAFANNPPDELKISRGGNNSEKEYKEKCQSILNEKHELTTKIFNVYKNYYENIKVIYSKTKTKEEILKSLSVLEDNNNVIMMEESLLKLNELNTKLEDLLNENLLKVDDPMFEEINRINEYYKQFSKQCLDDDGYLKPYNISDIIVEVELEDFSFEHRFLAETESNNKILSNDFLIIAKEKNTNDDESSENEPIVFAKYISVGVKQPNFPYWTAGIDYILPIGGIKNYSVSRIEGDVFSGVPDSLHVNIATSNIMQLAIGTKLNYDIPTNNRIINPQVIGGMSLSNLNLSTANWRLNFLLGSGISFKQFPHIAINSGLVLNQQKVLKKEFFVNRTFAEPELNDSENKAIFKTIFKPGIFFGINVRL